MCVYDRAVEDDHQQTIRTSIRISSGRYLFANVNPDEQETRFDPTLLPDEYYIRIQTDQGENLNYQLELERSSLFITPIST